MKVMQRSRQTGSSTTTKLFGEYTLLYVTLLLVTLKLTGNIGWDWIWIFSPIWVPIVMVMAVFLGILLMLCFAAVVVWTVGAISKVVTKMERKTKVNK